MSTLETVPVKLVVLKKPVGNKKRNSTGATGLGTSSWKKCGLSWSKTWDSWSIFSRVRFDHAISPWTFDIFHRGYISLIVWFTQHQSSPYQLGAVGKSGKVYFTHQQLRLLHWQSIAAWVHLKPQWHSDIVVGTFALCQSETYTVLPCRLFPAMFLILQVIILSILVLELSSSLKAVRSFPQRSTFAKSVEFLGHKKTSR